MDLVDGSSSDRAPVDVVDVRHGEPQGRWIPVKDRSEALRREGDRRTAEDDTARCHAKHESPLTLGCHLAHRARLPEEHPVAIGLVRGRLGDRAAVRPDDEADPFRVQAVDRRGGGVGRWDVQRAEIDATSTDAARRVHHVDCERHSPILLHSARALASREGIDRADPYGSG